MCRVHIYDSEFFNPSPVFLQPIVDEDSEEEEEVTTTTEEHTQPVPLSTDSSELNSTDSNSLSGKTHSHKYFLGSLHGSRRLSRVI